jgi:hypothetical protein
MSKQPPLECPPGLEVRLNNYSELIRQLGRSNPGPPKFHNPPLEFREEIYYLYNSLQQKSEPELLSDAHMDTLLRLVPQICTPWIRNCGAWLPF